MLSPEGIIQIGKWIFKIDAENEKVYALHEQNRKLLAELKKDTPAASDKIRVFSTNDEVLSILEDEGARKDILCFREDGAPSHTMPWISQWTNGAGQECQMFSQVYYQKLGVYFSLAAKAETQYQALLGLWWPYRSGIGEVHVARWKVKCGDYGENIGSNSISDNSLTVRVYESSRALNKYQFQISFGAESVTTPYLYIEGNW